MTKKNKILLAVLVAVLMVVTVFVAACTDPHVCGHVCTTCHKCTDSTCTDDACSDKCDYNGTHPATHPTCENQCPTCHKCLTPNCGHDACSDKCDYNGTHPSNAPIVTAPFYGAIGSLAMDGGDIAAMSVLSFTPNGTIWAGDQSADGYYDEDSATYTISDSGAISIKVGSDEIGTGSIVGRTISVTITLEGSNGSKEFTYTGDLYKASVSIDGNSTEWYIAQGTPLYLLLSERDPDSTIKVNDAEIPYDQLAVTCMPASDDVTIVVTSPAEELDEREYFLSGSFNGYGKTDEYTFSRTEGTNVYTLSNVKLTAGAAMKLRFNAAKWNDGSTQYAFGAYFFAKYSDVFESSTAWDDDAKVAAGKTGIYNITLTTKGANTATTGREENQIESMVFEYVGSYETEDMGWYLTGSMNSWAATGPTDYKLNGSGNLWTGTFTFDTDVQVKAIHVTKIDVNGDISYSVTWSNANDKSISAGKYEVTYNSTSDSISTKAYYTVEYMPGEHAADGITLPGKTEYLAGATIDALPAAINGAEGWVFDGWNDGTTTYPAGSSYTVTKNATLTAVWAKVISIDALVGVWKDSSDNEAIFTTVHATSENTAVGSVIVNNVFINLFYALDSNNTVLQQGSNIVTMVDDNTVIINGVTYTKSDRSISNTNLAAFAGTWQQEDSTFTVTITADSTDYNSDHFIIDKYLVLYDSSANYYLLYMDNGSLKGYYVGEEVSFTDEVTTIDIDNLVGIYKNSNGDLVYLSKNAIDATGLSAGCIIVNNVYVNIKYNSDQTGFEGSYSNWAKMEISVNGDSITISIYSTSSGDPVLQSETTYTYEGEFTPASLSDYNGVWTTTEMSMSTAITVTLTVNADSNSVELKKSNNTNVATSYVIIDKYLVVYSTYYYMLTAPQEGAIKGHRSAPSNGETVEVTFEAKTDDCAWADYLGAWIDDDEEIYGVIITRYGLIVTIDEDTYLVPVSDLSYDDGEFEFTIDGVEWTMTYNTAKGWWNFYDYPEETVDTNLSRLGSNNYSKFVGIYGGTTYEWSEDEDGDYYPDKDKPEHEFVIIITATGNVIVTIDGEDATVTELEPYGNGIDLTIDGVCYNIGLPRSNATDDDGFAIKIELLKYDGSDYYASSYDVGTLDRITNFSACEWAAYIGVYGTVDSDDSDDEYQDGTWLITITADSITVAYNGTTYTATNIEFDPDEEEFGTLTFNLDGFIDGAVWGLILDSDGVINLYSKVGSAPPFSYPVDIYLKA